MGPLKGDGGLVDYEFVRCFFNCLSPSIGATLNLIIITYQYNNQHEAFSKSTVGFIIVHRRVEYHTPRTRATISALMVSIERNRPIIFEHQRDDNTNFRRSRRRPLPGVIVVTAGKKKKKNR